MKTLDPISIPLNQSSLIEASAGTGKTYTMANLYLRLILGVGCEPMMVEQILVVTFTKAATQELRERIRTRLAETAKAFGSPEREEATRFFDENPFIFQLYEQVKPNLNEALLRLRLAERDMDLSSIFTIDSFCQKMLFQYAFDSGVRFDINLQTDEQALLTRLSEETWRELFYPASLMETQLVANYLGTPKMALEKVSKYLSEVLPPLSEAQQAWLAEDYQTQAVRFEQFLTKVRTYWRENEANIIQPIATAFARQQSENIKILDGRSYKEKSFLQWQATLSQWAGRSDWDFPEKTLSYFCQSMLQAKAAKGAEVLVSPHFAMLDTFFDEYQSFRQVSSDIRTKLRYRYFCHLRQKLESYKQSHVEKNFNDMLHYFHQALMGENGAMLAQRIRTQFQFAMVDESQDTNQIQYQIFHRIFIEGTDSQGFIMIGDPKQSIYKFRGADIFAYLTASQQVAERFTLNKNWRSLPKIVENVNQLFTFPTAQSPFLYDDIRFSPVQSKETETHLLNDEQEINLYQLPDDYQVEEAAAQCAEQIQQGLTQAEQGKLFVKEAGKGERALQPKDIAILVRSHKEAAVIKRSLSERNIQSVFLSEKKSVFSTQEAKDMVLILNACLQPFSQKTVLTALGSTLWGLTARELYQLKNSEAEWENYVEQFLDYQQIWQGQGVLPMLHQLFIEQGIVARLNSTGEADRRLTNILHLAELLQEKMQSVENESALVRWFQQQIDNPKENEDQILRLESEADLIKIVTIHQSKGLQYPVVWLPFIAKEVKSRASEEAMSLYRDDQGQLHWNFNAGDEQIKQWQDQADYAEDLRLLYVALTRAEYQLHLILPKQWGGKWNAMHYLLGNGTLTKEAQTEDYLTQKQLTYRLQLLGEITKTRFEPKSAVQTAVVAKEFTGKIREIGKVTSFSALQAQHERLQHSQGIAPLARLDDDAQDYDRSTVVTTGEMLQVQGDYSPYHFPHSTKVGNLLHRFFELQDFRQPIETSRVAMLCEQLDLNEEWITPVQQWFEQILHTPFGDAPFCLAEVESHKRLNEWAFYVSLKNPQALPKLNRLLKQHSRLAQTLPDLQFFQFEGFVRGFIDAIVQVENRFYVIDYKSNFLGYLPQDYALENIEKTMGLYRYDLQYLLYTLAVHRYLRSRLGDHYDYERDFGGVAYLFLRGMNGTPQSGVYFEKPSATLIDEMDQLFG